MENIELSPCPGYPLTMNTKQKVLKAVESLPEDASVEDAMERFAIFGQSREGAPAGRRRSNHPS